MQMAQPKMKVPKKIIEMLLKNGKEWIDSFQHAMREELEIPKLKIGFNKVSQGFGDFSRKYRPEI